MGTFGLFLILGWLLGSALGRILLLALALWYLDNRYVGLLAGLGAPVVRSRRVAGLRQAIEVNPSDVRSMVELGEHYLRGGNYRAAAEYLERATLRREDGARALYLLGAAWVKLGRYEAGSAQLAAALAKTPEIAFGEPYLYLLEATFATAGPQAPRVAELVAQFEHFDSVEVLARAGQICAAAGRKDLARRLLEQAVHNYSYTPRPLRRRARRWMVRARLGLLMVR